MKIKLGLIFLGLAVLISFGVFNYHSFFEARDADVSAAPKELNRKDIIEFFNASENIDYNLKVTSIPFVKILDSKAVYIHFWASWCGPCLNEIPELIAYAKRNKNTAQFILVSLDTSREDLNKFLKSFPELNDEIFVRIWDKDSVIAKKINVDRLPMTLILPAQNSTIKIFRSVVDWKEQ